MYRIVRLTENGWDLLTRSKHMNGWELEPVFAMSGDPRVITYGTKLGALKRMASLRRSGYNVVVIDEDGMEIPESEIQRGDKR